MIELFLSLFIIALVIAIIAIGFALYYRSEYKALNNQDSFEKCLQDFSEIDSVIQDRDTCSDTAVDGFLDYQLTRISKSLNKVLSAYAKEYGKINIDNKLHIEFEELSGSLCEEWRDLKKDLNHTYHRSDYLIQANNKMHAFVMQSVFTITSSLNECKYGKAVNSNNRKIFIVHGRDHAFRDKVASFLKQNNFEPIILENRANRGQFILEKFLSEAQTVSFAIVLMTADDTVQGEDDITSSRARQNVILELGYFISCLGKERIIILKDSAVENPSDISGLVYEPINNNDSWKNRILKELHELGYEKR